MIVIIILIVVLLHYSDEVCDIINAIRGNGGKDE